MLRNRLFNIFIVIALITVVALTAREAFATSIITSETDAAIKCESLPSRHSIHAEHVNTTSTRLAYTEDGPTGIDGGLIYLLSAYRTCSK